MEKAMSKTKWIFITTVMITMTLGIAGCGKNTEDKDGTGTPVVVAEDLPRELGKDVPGTENADAQGREPEKSVDMGQDGTALPVSTEGDVPFHYINEDKDLYGDIWEVGEGQFTVTEIYNEKLEDGSELMVAPAEEAVGETPKITVVYDEKTKFIRQTIRDGGASHEEKEGTAADLEKGLTAEMNGSYEGDIFHATEILIVEVILN